MTRLCLAPQNDHTASQFGITFSLFGIGLVPTLLLPLRKWPRKLGGLIIWLASPSTHGRVCFTLARFRRVEIHLHLVVGDGRIKMKLHRDVVRYPTTLSAAILLAEVVGWEPDIQFSVKWPFKLPDSAILRPPSWHLSLCVLSLTLTHHESFRGLGTRWK